MDLSSSIWTVAGGYGSRTSRFPKPVRLVPVPTRQLHARGAVQASVVFDSEDRAFVADMAGFVSAFAPDGKRIWERQLEGSISATPACDPESGWLFAGTHEGWVYCLENADGAVLWRKRLPSWTDARILSDLLFVPALRAVVLSSWGESFRALEALSGQTLQSWAAGIHPQSGAAATANGDIYFVRAVRGRGISFARVINPATHAYDAGFERALMDWIEKNRANWRQNRRTADGAGLNTIAESTQQLPDEWVLHQQPEGDRGAGRMNAAASPVLDEELGIAWFIANDGRKGLLHAWSIKKERLLWKQPVPRQLLSAPAVAPDGTSIVADMSGSLRAWAADGSPLYQYSSGTDYLLAGPVCDSEGNAFFGDVEGRLHHVTNSGTGNVIFEAQRSIQGRPAFDSLGNLYLPATDRRVYVFKNASAA
jgi:outer membrane protein assembly factor BamB